MTAISIALVIVVVYIAVTSIVAVGYVNNQRKELESKHEDKIAKIGGISLAQAIEIEMLNETVEQLRFKVVACKSCRKDTVDIVADYREKIKELTECLNSANEKAEYRRLFNIDLTQEILRLSGQLQKRDNKTGRFTKKSKP